MALRDELGSLPLPKNIAEKLGSAGKGQGLIAEFIEGVSPDQRRWLLVAGVAIGGDLPAQSAESSASPPPPPPFKQLRYDESYLYLRGTSLEFSTDPLNGGFSFQNPNAKKSCGCGTSFSV